MEQLERMSVREIIINGTSWYTYDGGVQADQYLAPGSVQVLVLIHETFYLLTLQRKM